ncbi:MAG: 50S ribosomal protein L4 [Pirellulaceae bacterium]
MATLPVYDKSGKEIGKYEIDPSVIADNINKQLLHDAVIMYQANMRQGTRGTKSRADVAGSTKKMYRQKGTGNARAGGKRTNVRRGGGHAFALRTRDFSYRLPKKAVRLATRMAIAGKIQDNEVVVVDDFGLSAPKTKEVAGFLKAVGLEGKSTLIATNGLDPMVYRSARNISRVSVAPAAELNAWSVLRPHRVVFTKAALDWVKEQAAGKNEE